MMMMPNRLAELFEQVKKQKIKRRLKAAFRRTPRPSRVVPEKEDH